MKQTKAQLWYLDFIIGVTLFVIILIVSFRYVTTNVLSGKEASHAPIDADKISEYLVSEGIPKNWTEDDIVIIGITSGDNMINLTKVELFKNMSQSDYNNVKFLFGISSDFIISFQDSSGNLLNLTNQTYIGKPGITLSDLSSTDPNNLMTIMRYLVYKHDGISEIVGMKVIVWQE